MKKRLLPLALALLMVVALVPSALAAPALADLSDSYKDDITIEDGVGIIRQGFYGFGEKDKKVMTITNATSLGTYNGMAVVCSTAPTTVTVLEDAYIDSLGGSVIESTLTDKGEFDSSWDNLIDITSGIREDNEDGDSIVRSGATYVLKAGYYHVFAAAEGGIFIFVSDSTAPTSAPAPTPAPPVAEPVPTTGSAAELKTTDGLVKVVPPSPTVDKDLAYTVQAGEKLFGIAYNYYGSMSDATISKIYNANSEYFKKTKGILEVGAVIILPAKGLIAPVTQNSLSTAAGMYLVKAVDTLADIAKAYYGDSKAWTKIYEANKDRVKMVGKSPMIYEGQWLVIPE